MLLLLLRKSHVSIATIPCQVSLEDVIIMSVKAFFIHINNYVFPTTLNCPISVGY